MPHFLTFTRRILKIAAATVCGLSLTHSLPSLHADDAKAVPAAPQVVYLWPSGVPTVEFHNMLFRAGVPSDLHIYAHGGHGGAINNRKGIPFGTWHIRFQDWLADLGMLKAAPM